MSKRELEALTRRYIAEIIDAIGPEKDVPAPDVNTNEQTMAWIMDTYSMHARHTVTAVVTGKPMALGGSRGRPEATGRGCMMVTLKALARLNLKPAQARVVVQGFGNVGGMASKLMSKVGFKIVAIVEYDGAVYNRKGLDIAALQQHRKETGSITGFAGGEDMDKHEAMFLECDVLIPAATENVIHSGNASRLRCKILCEGANGPTTFLADEILAEKKIFVIPDILANSGGVATSYYEWYQNMHNLKWTKEKVLQKLKTQMERVTQDVFSMQKKHKVNLRDSAWLVALKRLEISDKG
jgi:glutamate dehydrogenase (NAD(P)+)